MTNTVLTCVYCGHQYPEGTPSAKHELLTEHIRVCEKHPLRDAELKIKTLCKALSGILGCNTIEELNGLEVIVRTNPVPDSDKMIMINAIDALRSCIID